jgi:hypothetical protein
MKLTFGITTGGGQEDYINKIIDSIEEEQIPDYEIVVVGSFLTARNNTIVYLFPEDIVPMWITKKKNLIAEVARGEILVLMHDYIRLEKGWYEGFLRFQNENPIWDVAMCKLKDMTGRRLIDWMGLAGDKIYGNVLLPYDYSNPKGMYVPGNFFMVKRDFLRANPLDERRNWGLGEDVEWSKRIFGGIENAPVIRNLLQKPLDVEIPDPEYPAIYRMNVYSSVMCVKEKDIHAWFRNEYDMHTPDIERPIGYKIEDYVYMQKRLERKIES